MASEKDTIDNITDLIAVVREFLAADTEALNCLLSLQSKLNVTQVQADAWRKTQREALDRCVRAKTKMREIMTNL